MYWYRTEKERLRSPELGTYSTYGIRVFQTDRQGSQLLFTVQDVSLNRTMVNKLVQDCTKGQLEPSHLKYVIEDRISSR